MFLSDCVFMNFVHSIVFHNRIKNARERRTLTFNKQVYLSPEFVALWEKIKHRTRYRVSFDTRDLIHIAGRRIREMEAIQPVHLTMTRVEVEITQAGVSADRKLEEKSREAIGVNRLPDILAYLQQETELTRHTLAEILSTSGRLQDFPKNPQQFMAAAAREITRALQELLLEGIQYEKIADHYWEMGRIAEEAEAGIVRYLNHLYEVQHQDKSLFDQLAYDSEVERQFARDLDNHDYVRLFVKLPGWFKIDTPIGSYNPDWAFVTERDEQLYFVRETKSTRDHEALRNQETQKIKCGQKHFEELGVDYAVVTGLSEVRF